MSRCQDRRCALPGRVLPALLVSLPLVAAEPIPDNEESVAAGAQLFLQYCTECHGRDGRAETDVIADATNLTAPEEYYNGASREAMFRSIGEGAGVAMPPFSFQLSDEADIWHLVNFIRSLWTPEQRDSY